jgi:predicted enzyme related to lactoylglutathione lyase
MPKRTSYAQGTPCWVDLQSHDPEAAKAFYEGLFGWEFDDQPMPQGPPYSMALKHGEPVAAISPMPSNMVLDGTPPYWNSYISVDDLDATTKAAKAAGAQVLAEPFDVMAAGRMSVVIDPTGALINFWQAGQHIGATLVNEPGTLIWNELITDNGEVAYAFYDKVLGLKAEQSDLSGSPYFLLKVGDEMVGGSMAPPMEGISNHWHVYFAVEAMEPALEKARQLGAKVINGPRPTPIGPMATVSDPQGAIFSLFQPFGQAT